MTRGSVRTASGSPAARSVPPAITSTGRQSSITTSRLCSMTRTVTPLPVQGATMRSTMVSRRAGFTPAAGSSRSSSARLRHEGPRQLEQLPLAARQHARRLACERARDRRSRGAPAPARAGAAPPRRPRRAGPVRPEPLAQLVLGRQHDVLQHRHRREGARHLEGARDAAREHPVGRLAVEPAPVEEDPPRGRRERARDEVEERGLAGAVRPDQAGEAARPHAQRHVEDGRVAAEAPGDVLELEHGGPGLRIAAACHALAAPVSCGPHDSEPGASESTDDHGRTS